MTDPVDLTQFHKLTGGDQAFEAELMELFYETVERCLNQLQSALQAQDAQNWRDSAHELKGAALNLGANDLAALCKQAQEAETADETAKQQLLEQLHSHYHTVEAFMQKHA